MTHNIHLIQWRITSHVNDTKNALDRVLDLVYFRHSFDRNRFFLRITLNPICVAAAHGGSLYCIFTVIRLRTAHLHKYHSHVIFWCG